MQGHTVQEDAASNQIPAATKVMAIRELYDQILGLMNLEDKLKCARLNKEWRESMYNTPITMEQFKEEWIEFRKKLRHIKAHCVVQTVLQKHKCEEGVCPAEDCPQENNPPELAATDVVQCCFHPETAFNEMVRHTNEYMTSNPEATYNCSRTDETRRKVWNGATRQEIIWTVSKEASFTWRDSYGYVEPDAHDGTMEVDN
ncbi:hypothetical protein BGX31_005851 [Mortierella sp. GBA43]|nr:hypothetical protein BGX31_005851 [Mortierella sp. GBA43]